MKWVRSLLLLCSVLLSLNLQAAGPILLPDSEFDDSITHYVSVLEDPLGDVSIADLQNQELQRRFTPSHASSLRYSHSTSTYWVRFSIDNPYPSNRFAIVALSNNRFSDVELYDISKSGQFQQLEFDGSMPFARGRYLQAHPHLLPLPGKTTSSYLMKINAHGLLNSEIRLLSPQQFVHNEESYAAVQGIITGWLLATAAYFIHTAITRGVMLSWFAALYCLAGAGLGSSWMGQLGVLLGRNNLQPESIAAVCTAILILGRSLIFYSLSWIGYRAQRTRQTLIASGAVFSLILIAFAFDTRYTEFTIPALLLLSELSLLIAASAGECRQGHRAAIHWLIGGSIVTSLIASSVLMTSFNLIEIDFLSVWSCMMIPIIQALLLVVAVMKLMNQPLTGLGNASRGITSDPHLLEKISRELKTPAGNLSGISQLLLETPLTTNQRDYAETLGLSAREMLQVANEIFDLAEIQDEHLKLSFEHFDMQEATMSTFSHFRQRANRQHVELLLDHEDDFQSHVEGDEARMKTVLYNLISGLLDHFDTGSLSIHLSNTAIGHMEGMCCQIRVNGSITKRDVLLSFMDDLKSQTNKEQKLSDQPWKVLILQRLLNFMQIAVEVEALTNRVLSLTLYVPLETRPETKTVHRHQDDSLIGTNVLIIDSSAALRKVIDKQVRRWGVRPQETHSGKEALAMLRNQCSLMQPFDAIIVDHDMAALSGIELARRIHDDELIHPKPGVLLLSGASLESLRDDAKKAGILQLVEKPVSSHHLRAAMTALKYQPGSTESQTPLAP